MNFIVHWASLIVQFICREFREQQNACACTVDQGDRERAGYSRIKGRGVGEGEEVTREGGGREGEIQQHVYMRTTPASQQSKRLATET